MAKLKKLTKTEVARGHTVGMCDMALEKYGCTNHSITEFLTHHDVINHWSNIFLLQQVLQYISDVRDERLHDVTAVTLRLK